MILDDDRTVSARINHTAINELHIRHQMMQQLPNIAGSLNPKELILYFTVDIFNDEDKHTTYICYIKHWISREQISRLRTPCTPDKVDNVIEDIYEDLKQDFYSKIKSNDDIYGNLKIEDVYVTAKAPIQIS